MKKTVFSLAAIILLSVGSVYAQPAKADKAKFKKEREAKRQMEESKVLEKKLAYFKENLMLTKQESADFDKAYRNYAQKRQELRKRYRNGVTAKIGKGSVAELTEQERQAIIQAKLKIDQDRADLKREFTIELTKILPSTKVIRYFKLDKQFNKQLMHRLKKRKEYKKRKRVEEREQREHR